MQIRTVVVAPLGIDFGVCEDRPIVYFKSGKLLSAIRPWAGHVIGRLNQKPVLTALRPAVLFLRQRQRNGLVNVLIAQRADLHAG